MNDFVSEMLPGILKYMYILEINIWEKHEAIDFL